jgi:hypothetical protein
LQELSLELKPVYAWTAILALVGFTALCLLAHVGGILRLAYPAGCFLVGVLLYFRYPILYVGFTWWVWFLSAFVRRLVDVQSGWVDPSPILLAPFLTTLVTIVTLVRYLPRAYRQGGLPFILALMGVFYGFLVGLVKDSPMAVAVPMLNWLTPVLFGLHLFVNWQDYPRYRQNMQRVFIWGVLVMGIYGVVQYLVAPGWDRFWLSNQETLTFGTPEPLGIRVFSTMQSPQPFAFVMGAGLILLFSCEGVLRFFAAGGGYLSFLLSLARSAWLGWFMSLALFIPSLKPRLQIRLIVTLMVMALLVLPLTTVEPFASVINTRLNSLVNVQNDDSYSARSAGYSQAFGLAVTQVIGKGLGGTIASDDLGGNDSGVLTLLFLLGWFGTLFYLSGLVLLTLNLSQKIGPGTDLFVSASRAIALGAFVQIGLNNVMLSVFGMVLWGFLGMILAAQRYYYWHQRMLQLEEFHAMSAAPDG